MFQGRADCAGALDSRFLYKVCDSWAQADQNNKTHTSAKGRDQIHGHSVTETCFCRVAQHFCKPLTEVNHKRKKKQEQQKEVTFAVDGEKIKKVGSSAKEEHQS